MKCVRPIDADVLEYDTEWSEYMDGFTSYSQLQIDCAPTLDVVEVSRLKDVIAEVLRSEFLDGVYCYTCRFDNRDDEEAETTCGWCYRKHMGWAISDEEIDSIADAVIIKLKNTEEVDE